MPDLLHQIDVHAHPATIYDALVTEEGLKGWWTDDTKAKPKVGAKALFGFGNGDSFTMKITELEHGKSVRWTCLEGPPEWIGTDLSWHLGPGHDGATRIHFAHTGWASTEGSCALCNTTWGHLMQVLKDYVEGKNPGPHFSALQAA